MEEIQIDSQLCKQCRGRCCQGHPGVWSDPQRFFAIFSGGRVPTTAEFVHLLDHHQLTLRDLGGVLIPSPRFSDDGCAAQGPQGCAYAIDQRPGQCLALTPQLETLLDDHIHCTMPPQHASGTARNNWRRFKPLLNLVRFAQ